MKKELRKITSQDIAKAMAMHYLTRVQELAAKRPWTTAEFIEARKLRKLTTECARVGLI